MKVTKLYVASTQGANRQPSSGDAWFSDGKSYEWMRLPGGKFGEGFRFFTYRSTHQGTGRALTGFTSPARERALTAYLDA